MPLNSSLCQSIRHTVDSIQTSTELRRMCFACASISLRTQTPKCVFRKEMCFSSLCTRISMNVLYVWLMWSWQRRKKIKTNWGFCQCKQKVKTHELNVFLFYLFVMPYKRVSFAIRYKPNPQDERCVLPKALSKVWMDILTSFNLIFNTRRLRLLFNWEMSRFWHSIEFQPQLFRHLFENSSLVHFDIFDFLFIYVVVRFKPAQNEPIEFSAPLSSIVD